jgi:hypothetical protein
MVSVGVPDERRSALMGVVKKEHKRKEMRRSDEEHAI